MKNHVARHISLPAKCNIHLCFYVALGFLCLVASACNLGLASSSSKETNCGEKAKDQCYTYIVNGTETRCVWNFDRCTVDFSDEPPNLPKELTKAKQITAGSDTICAIDDKDQLWCVAKQPGFNTLPNESHKFQHVAMIADEICAVKTDGKGLCQKGKDWEPSRYSKGHLRLVPGANKMTCMIESEGSHLINCSGNYESFGDHYEKFINLNPGFGLARDIYISIPNVVVVISDQNKLVEFGLSNGKWAALGGMILKVTKFSIAPLGEAFCAVRDSTLSCGGKSYTDGLITIPTELTNEEFVDVATGSHHTCVILKNDQALKCFGSKIRIEKIPTDRKNVKSVAIGLKYTCIIGGDDKPECFSSN